MGSIQVRGAREHNLRGIDVDIPLGKLTCVTGVSGCGKSSLVHDTLYAESQRMFLEGLSGNGMGQQLMKAPDVDSIHNLRPSLNVSQSYYNFNPRSTVGTVTEVSHRLRSLFALVASWETGHRLDDAFFSRNNPSSWCPECQGTGERYAISLNKLIPDRTKKLSSGAILYYKGGKSSPERKTLLAICERFGVNPDARFCDLDDDQIDLLLNRTTALELSIRYKNPRGAYRERKIISRGVLVELEEKLKDVDTPSTLASISKYLEHVPCKACCGSGLNAQARSRTVCGSTIGDAERTNLAELLQWIKTVRFAYVDSPISKPVSTLCDRILRRLGRLVELKVGYLNLSRKVPTLSGGESQRVRIANQLSCSLNGLVYILDEPCRGLHPRDAESVISATKELVARDNTVVAIEHNPVFLSRSDWEIRLGPLGGPNGGSVMRIGEPQEQLSVPSAYRVPARPCDVLSLDHLSQNNVRDVSVHLPLGVVTAITGVSGSGKSSLLAAMQETVDSMISDKSVPRSRVSCAHLVNQRPIGKTPRSTIASYLGTMDEIRKAFAETKDARILGLGPSSFSLNVSGGRCETCQGTGLEKVSYRYLPDTYIECPECHGRRFSDEVLTVRVWGMTVTDALDTPIEELVERIPTDSAMHEMLDCVRKIGLGYLALGQTSMSLSGGEAQRIKLAKALGRPGSGKGIYFLDEPTSGLEREDARVLAEAILSLTSGGATVVLTEHSPRFIEEVADHVIDLGAVAGRDGGRIACTGTPAEVFANPQSSWAGAGPSESAV